MGEKRDKKAKYDLKHPLWCLRRGGAHTKEKGLEKTRAVAEAEAAAEPGLALPRSHTPATCILAPFFQWSIYIIVSNPQKKILEHNTPVCAFFESPEEIINRILE